MTNTSPEALWDVSDVAAYLRVPVETVYRWRKRRIGPPAARIGRHLRYDPAVVRSWFASQTAARGEPGWLTSRIAGTRPCGFTLRTYTHLLPNSEDRTRRAIDRAFGVGPETDDGLETA